MLKEVLIRFLVGGAAVSIFSVVGDVFTPKSFAGLFGAAPSIALATLELTVLKEGHGYAAAEAQSMMLGGVAFFIYANCLCWLARRYPWRIMTTTLALIPLWLAIALGAWFTI